MFRFTYRRYICNSNVLPYLVTSTKLNLFSRCLPHVSTDKFPFQPKTRGFFPFLLPGPVDGTPPSYSRSTKIMNLQRVLPPPSLLLLSYNAISRTTSFLLPRSLPPPPPSATTSSPARSLPVSLQYGGCRGSFSWSTSWGVRLGTPAAAQARLFFDFFCI
jgi:hypothetical protein